MSLLQSRRVVLPALRRAAALSTSAQRQSAHIIQQGIPGANLPFDINNRHKLLALFIVYFGSGLGAPFLLVRHQLLKD